MEQAMTGQLAPAKYLFEMASIYPATTDGSFSTVDEESLAATLMRRLDLPDKPIERDEEDPLKTANSAEAPTAKVSDGDKRAESGSDLRSESDSSIPAGASAGADSE